MTLHISESDVRAVLTMPMAIEAVEEISRKQATGEVVLHPRRRFEFPGGRFFHHMAAADLDANRVAAKQYTYVNGKLKFAVHLYSMETGDLLALIEGDCLSQKRTGAASGVATKYMARSDAKAAAIIGTGWQAQAQLEAIAAVRNLESVVVYGRDDARREKFAREMSERLKIPVRTARSSAEAVRGATIICAATTSSQPVLFGADIVAGAPPTPTGARPIRKPGLGPAAPVEAGVAGGGFLAQTRPHAGGVGRGVSP